MSCVRAQVLKIILEGWSLCETAQGIRKRTSVDFFLVSHLTHQVVGVPIARCSREQTCRDLQQGNTEGLNMSKHHQRISCVLKQYIGWILCLNLA